MLLFVACVLWFRSTTSLGSDRFAYFGCFRAVPLSFSWPLASRSVDGARFCPFLSSVLLPTLCPALPAGRACTHQFGAVQRLLRLFALFFVIRGCAPAASLAIFSPVVARARVCARVSRRPFASVASAPRLPSPFISPLTLCLFPATHSATLCRRFHSCGRCPHGRLPAFPANASRSASRAVPALVCLGLPLCCLPVVPPLSPHPRRGPRDFRPAFPPGCRAPL